MLTVNCATAEFHDILNPKIWSSDNQLLEDVRDKLIEIVNEFVDFVDFDIRVIDAHIVGSNAAYNYTQYSDLDLHLIVNYDSFDASNQIVELLMWSQKKLFNDTYDLSIRGIDVEVYVEDVRSVTVSNGIYSLFEDKWLKFPTAEVVDIDDSMIDELVDMYRPQVEAAIHSDDAYEVSSTIDTLYLMRKNGLAVEGEYSVGNLAFKEFRNLGYIEKLKDRLIELKSEELCIASKQVQ